MAAGPSLDTFRKWGVALTPLGAETLTIEQFLAADLCDLVRRSLLEPFLPLDNNNTAPLPFCLLAQVVASDAVATDRWGVLQVMSAVNITQSMTQRVAPWYSEDEHVHRATADVPSNDAEEGGVASSGGRRVAKLLVTDGRALLAGVELTPCRALDTVAMGGKIRIIGHLRMCNGIALLTDDNVVALGGSVARLRWQYEADMKALAKALSGAPSHAVRPVAVSSNKEPTTAQPSASTASLASTAAIRNDAPPPDNGHPMYAVVEGQIKEVHSSLSLTEQGEYNLVVLLGVSKVLQTDPRIASVLPISSDAYTAGEAQVIEVDLGHPWLMHLLGMSPDDFLQLSDVAAAGDIQADRQLQRVIDRVSIFLEQYGLGRFWLSAPPLVTQQAAAIRWTVLQQERQQ